MQNTGIVVVGLSLLLASGAGLSRELPPPVATVGGKAIPRDEMEREVGKLQRRFKRRGRELTPDLLNRLKTNVVRSQIEEELLAQRFAKEGLAVKKADVDAYLAEVRSGFRHEKGYQTWLKETGQTDADLREQAEKQLRYALLAAKLAGGKRPTMEDAKKAYEADPDKYMVPPRANVRQIFLDIPRGASDAEREEIGRRAAGIADKARKEPKRFSELAKRYSEGPTAKDGGKLGDVRVGRMPAAFDAAVFTAHEGDVVGPIETPYGLHIVYVEKKHPPQKKTVEDIGPSILKELQATYLKDTRRALYKRLYEEGDVVILEPGVALDAQSFASPEPGRQGGAH